jgi:hypothetical protein
MSTLATTNLKNPSSGTNNIELETNGNVTATGTVSATTVTSSGSISDSVSDVRTPRFTEITSDSTISNEGVYKLTNDVSIITLGAPAIGTVMAVYNNSPSSVTLEDGATVTSMRLGADNNNTHNNTLTLGTRSMTTITFIATNVCVVTGTDVS